MILQDYFNEDQIELLREANIRIESRDYNCEELYNMEHDILDYINGNCTNEKFFSKEEMYDEILDIIMDLENESDEVNPMTIEIVENDHVELNNGKTGIVIDITNNVYTIEADEVFRTGNIDEDIMIVASNSILGMAK